MEITMVNALISAGFIMYLIDRYGADKQRVLNLLLIIVLVQCIIGVTVAVFDERTDNVEYQTVR